MHVRHARVMCIENFKGFTAGVVYDAIITGVKGYDFGLRVFPSVEVESQGVPFDSFEKHFQVIVTTF